MPRMQRIDRLGIASSTMGPVPTGRRPVRRRTRASVMLVAAQERVFLLVREPESAWIRGRA